MGGGGGGGGGGCIWIIASALWSRVFSLRLVNELKFIRQRPGPGPRAWQLQHEMDGHDGKKLSYCHSLNPQIE